MKEKGEIARESGTVDQVTESYELLEPVAEGLSEAFQGVGSTTIAAASDDSPA